MAKATDFEAQSLTDKTYAQSESINLSIACRRARQGIAANGLT
jgi:hypothetical protein